MIKVSDLPTLVDQTEVTLSFSSTETNLLGSLTLELEQAESPTPRNKNVKNEETAMRLIERFMNDPQLHLT
jgi:hypothetical protein